MPSSIRAKKVSQISEEKDLAPFYFAVPVWGKDYVGVFLRTALAAQLSPNNLPKLRNLHRCRYHIYTTESDEAVIEGSPTYHRLKSLIATKIYHLDSEFPEIRNLSTPINRYELKSACYRHSMAIAAKAGAANVLLNADIVLGDGFLDRCAGIIAAGKRVIEVVGPRATQMSVETILHERFRAADGVAISASFRQLASLWVDHIHPMALIHLWEGSRTAPFHPSHLYWKVGKHSILVRCFHIYPIVFFPRQGNVSFRGTIDDDLVANACLEFKDIHIAIDSDELFCLELSAEDHSVGTTAERGNLRSVINFYRAYGRLWNFKLLSYRVRISGGDEEPSAWKRAERLSDWFVFRVYWTAVVVSPLLFIMAGLRRILSRLRNAITGRASQG